MADAAAGDASYAAFDDDSRSVDSHVVEAAGAGAGVAGSGGVAPDRQGSGAQRAASSALHGELRAGASDASSPLLARPGAGWRRPRRLCPGALRRNRGVACGVVVALALASVAVAFALSFRPLELDIEPVSLQYRPEQREAHATQLLVLSNPNLLAAHLESATLLVYYLRWDDVPVQFERVDLGLVGRDVGRGELAKLERMLQLRVSSQGAASTFGLWCSPGAEGSITLVYSGTLALTFAGRRRSQSWGPLTVRYNCSMELLERRR
jgi:hypothetical protein